MKLTLPQILANNQQATGRDTIKLNSLAISLQLKEPEFTVEGQYYALRPLLARIGGLRRAFRTEQRRLDTESVIQEVSLNEININPQIEPALFEMPVENG